MDTTTCHIPPTVIGISSVVVDPVTATKLVVFSLLGNSLVVVDPLTANDVVELSGFLVVGVVKENVVCEYPTDDARACLLTPFFEITVILYNVAGLRLEIVT